MPIPTFADMLKLIEDRSAALRSAAGQAGPDTRVPGCPDWSVRDLVAHLGEVQRFWAAAVAAGPATAPPAEDQVHDIEPGDDLIGWSAASTDELVRALSEAGPAYAAMRAQLAAVNARIGTTSYLSQIVEQELKKSEPPVK